MNLNYTDECSTIMHRELNQFSFKLGNLSSSFFLTFSFYPNFICHATFMKVRSKSCDMLNYFMRPKYLSVPFVQSYPKNIIVFEETKFK